MKYILSIVLSIILTSCSSDKQNNTERKVKIEKRANREISRNIEKLVLLSEIEAVDYNKTKEVIELYLLTSLDRKVKLENKEDYSNLIITIGNKTNLTSKEVSSIIFAYKYEMRTSDEIIEEFTDGLEEEYGDPSDNYR